MSCWITWGIVGMRWTLQTFIDSNNWSWLIHPCIWVLVLASPQPHLYMTILSFGDFYLGIDKRCFTNVSIHLWSISLEWGGPAPLDFGTAPRASHRWIGLCCIQSNWTHPWTNTGREHADASIAVLPICLLSRQLPQGKDGARPRTQRCIRQS